MMEGIKTESMIDRVEYLSIEDVLAGQEATEDVKHDLPTFDFKHQRAVTTNSFAELSSFIQKNNLPQPEIEIVDDPPFSSRFVGKLSIEGWVDEVLGGPCGSKKNVKEEMAKIALDRLKEKVAERWLMSNSPGSPATPSSPNANSIMPRVVEDEGLFMERRDLQPIAMRPTTSFYAELNSRIQKLGLGYPIIETEMKGTSFTGSIVIPGLQGRLRTADGVLFRSKKEVKEALAEAALVKVKDLEASKSPPGLPIVGKDDLYLSKLNTFCGESKIALPIYQEFQLGTRYSFEITLALEQANGKVFGDRNVTYPSKKAAKSHAAREAYLWLEENNLLAAKHKLKGKGACVLPEHRTLHSDVMLLAKHMGFSDPVVKLAPVAGAPGLCDVVATATDENGELILNERVMSVVGKKYARKVMMERVAHKLMRIAEARGVKVFTQSGKELTLQDYPLSIY